MNDLKNAEAGDTECVQATARKSVGTKGKVMEEAAGNVKTS